MRHSTHAQSVTIIKWGMRMVRWETGALAPFTSTARCRHVACRLLANVCCTLRRVRRPSAAGSAVGYYKSRAAREAAHMCIPALG